MLRVPGLLGILPQNWSKLAQLEQGVSECKAQISAYWPLFSCRLVSEGFYIPFAYRLKARKYRYYCVSLATLTAMGYTLGYIFRRNYGYR